MNSRLIMDADIVNAIDWRLSGLKEQQIDRAVASAVECGGDTSALIEIYPDVGWTTVCAILAKSAEQLCDTSLFYRAGFEVVFGYRKAIHATSRQDALSEAIVRHLVDVPEILPLTLWREFIRQAEDRDFRTIDGYDEGSNVISYRPERKIGYEAFYARFIRLKRKVVASAFCN